MLRRERGQVTAEYVGVLLLVAVIVSALAVSGPARPIADEAARAVCQIAGQCAGGGAATSVDPQAGRRAASDPPGRGAGDPDPAAVAAFFKGLDPDAVVVPGMDNDLDNFTGGDAERVQHQASQFDPDQVATIQWLGYDTPQGATALGTGAAESGAEALLQ